MATVNRPSVPFVLALAAECHRQVAPGDRVELGPETARRALDELRGVFALLRNDEPTGTTPQPGLGDVPTLVANARAAGSTVSLTMDVPGAEGSGATGLCVYRLVQEALSNAARHAPGAPMDVTVTAAGDRLHVRITNPSDSTAADKCSDIAQGHGILCACASALPVSGEPSPLRTAKPEPSLWRHRSACWGKGCAGMTIRCLVVDDQAMVREGFSALRGAQPGIEVVGQGQDGVTAVALAQELTPDVVLMDIRMPE